MWASIEYGNPHKIKYEGLDCTFDGYYLKDSNGKILLNYYVNHRSHNKGDVFRLLSTVQDGGKNYLGKCIKTGNLITFTKEQITFIKK